MIKILHLAVTGPTTIWLVFSNGSAATWSATDLIARDTVMTRPLADPAYFARAFVEAGALAWPNGFELSAESLHRRLKEAGILLQSAA
jgi:hypothetical protein